MIETPSNQNRKVSCKLVIFVLAAFMIGFFISPYLYGQIFGYRNAEECILAKGGSKAIFHACYELYPSAAEQQKRNK